MRTFIAIVTTLFLSSGFPSGHFCSSVPPIRVLILSGRNNHDWKTTTPKLQAILEGTGRFKVDVTENPAALTASFLEPYDVILSNWNSFGAGQDAEAWPEEAKQAYIDFVRRGKGHVVIHAGGTSFAGWDEYKRLTLATWKEGLTSHGPAHTFRVRIESVKHPVTAGLESFDIKDELWNQPAVARGATVLASSYSDPDKGGTGRWEPAVLVGRFDRGRTLTILLGHDVEAMENPGFQALLRRGVEWAATGRVADEAAPPARSGWEWEVQEGKSLALLGPEGIHWQFRFDPELDVPYFHPLNTIDGRLLTWDAPPDHIWHHGLWFSWKFINKVNYWEIDEKTGRPEGRTTWSDVKILPRDDFSARISMDISYRPAGESAPVMTEKRTIEIGRPDEAGAYSLDWTSNFTALEAVVLDRTPLPNEPGGQTWGGYSGLSVRFAKAVAVRKVVTSDGPITEFPDNRYRGKHTAMDYSGLFGGHPAGIAICDHPDNPGFPTPWYAIVEPAMSFFNAAVICYGPITLEPGQNLTLRYRVLVHPGRFDADRLRAEYDRFAATPGKNDSP
jgi:type 1 glutamine amidotransferase